MFDPVWLGNYIVPRWEAFLFVFGPLFFVVLLIYAAVAFGQLTK